MSDASSQSPADTRSLFSRLTAWISERPSSAETDLLRQKLEALLEQDGLATTPNLERALLVNIVKLRSREVVDCMIPRADIKAIDIETSPRELMRFMAETKHSRIPVYRDTLDDVLGFIHIKDLLWHMVQQETPPQNLSLREVLRPLLIVVPSMPATKLLVQMRLKRQHIALVVDEFGGVDGLVTIEDLVEEIVGEIEDEHDTPTPADIIRRNDGTLLVNARVPVELFEAKTGYTLLSEEEREEIDTLGGYVFHVAGHVPAIGDIIKSRSGLSFEVLEADESRIIRLRVRTAPKAEA